MPVLPGAEGLIAALKGKVDSVLVDRLNYHYADRVYRNYRLEWAKETEFFVRTAEELKKGFEAEGIQCEVFF